MSQEPEPAQPVASAANPPADPPFAALLESFSGLTDDEIATFAMAYPNDVVALIRAGLRMVLVATTEPARLTELPGFKAGFDAGWTAAGLDAEVDARMAGSVPTGGAEPAAYTGSGSLAAIAAGGEGFIWRERADAHPIPLYAAPVVSSNGIQQDAETLRYVSLFGGFCRDCADVDGICPGSGLPCQTEPRDKAIRHVLAAVAYGQRHGYLPRSVPTGGTYAEGYSNGIRDARHDIRILLDQLDALEEATGEGPEGEDRALIEQIRRGLAAPMVPDGDTR